MNYYHCTPKENPDRLNPKTSPSKSRRWLSRLLGLSLVLLGCAESPRAMGTELLVDAHMANGADAYPWGGAKEGQFQFNGGTASWALTGWAAGAHDLYTASTSNNLASGATEWTNSWFSLTLGPDTTTQADFELGINSYNVHGGNNPGAIQALFFTKGLVDSPTINLLTELDYNRDMKIIREVLQPGDGIIGGTGNGDNSWSQYILVAGINGENFSLNMHMYADITNAGPSGLWVRWDTGTSKMDYRPGQVIFTATKPALNQWKYYRGDILANIKEAIDYGCTHSKPGGGMMLSNTNYSNYKIASIAEDGYEATDLSDVKIRMANSHLYWGTNTGRLMLSVENANLGTLRNDFTGSVGEQITIGPTTIVATSLGRFVVAGNSGAHTVKLVTAAGVDVPSGSVTVNATSGAGGFLFANLAHPIALSASTTYYLVSSETFGGDQWYNNDTVVKPWIVYPTTAISVPGWVYKDSTYHTGGTANSAYGPLNLRYNFAFVQSTAPGTLLNNYAGYRGMEIVVGNEPITVTGLGRRNQPGNTQNHIVKLVNATTGTDVSGGSATWSPNGTVNGMNFVMLAAPVTLRANQHYYVVSQEFNGGDTWCQGADTTIAHTSVATVPNTVFGTGGTWTEGTVADYCNGSVSFLYTSPD